MAKRVSSMLPIMLITSISSSGCVLWMREPEFYTAELTELLEGRSEAIAACYDRVLEQQDPNAEGELVVEFDVLEDTGALANLVVDEHGAPDALADCVTTELVQLRLDPPDVNHAHATFTWQFTRGPQKRPPADPFAGVQATVLACYSTHLATVDREAKGELVIDYAFDKDSGAVARLDVVTESTTAPAPVVECAKLALAGARLDPDELDERNVAGRRKFTLRYQVSHPPAP
jgi:hypothetical protein